MSRTLTFFGAIDHSGGSRTTRVAERLTRLEWMDSYLCRVDNPPADAARVHRDAALQHLRAERFGKARKHLRALCRLEPNCAVVFYHLGQAYESDPYGCDRRAARCYHRAVNLNASEPKYRAVLGRALVRINNVRSGVKVLCKAAQAAPTDIEVMEVVADGLREAGQADMAFDLLCRALFLAPCDSQLRKLWDRAKFDMALERQKTQDRANTRDSQPSLAKIIPFIHLADPAADTNNNRRQDNSSQPGPHFMRLRAFRGGPASTEQK